MKTLKLTFATALLALASTAVKAQNTPELTYGVKAGVSFSTLKTGLNAINDKSGKVGLNAGAFARIGSNIFFQPEVNYVSFSNEYRFNNTKYESKFKQLNVPLMAGIKLMNTDQMNLRVSAGPDLYYNLNTPSAPAGHKYKNLSVGGVVNAGIDVGSLTFDARYSLGLSKLNKDLGQKSNIFSVSVGFKFQ